MDSAIIGDVSVDSWNIWASGPFYLSFPSVVDSTSPSTLQDIYGDMGWGFRPSNRIVLHFKSDRNSLGMVIDSLAFDGIKRYSIYSQAQPCGRKISPTVHVRCPIVHGVGTEPTLAQKVASSGGRPFWINKPPQNDDFALDALAN